jgi:hypothetical protein
VISWFQNFAFKFNLHRYTEDAREADALARLFRTSARLYKLNPVDPQLQSVWSLLSLGTYQVRNWFQ